MYIKKHKLVSTYAVLILTMFAISCGESGSKKTVESTDSVTEAPMISALESKGIGPITEVILGELNEDQVSAGKELYEKKCTACHNISSKLIGPPQAGILERRSPEWVMNMILNPSEMIKKDPTAKALLKEFNNVPMTEQGLTETDARAILEYFRTI